MLACLGLVVTFRSSNNLAATYGVALSGTMTITTHPVRGGGAEPVGLGLVEGGRW